MNADEHGLLLIIMERWKLVVDDKVIVETKAVARLQKAHEAQLLGYLTNAQYELGLLINFGSRVTFKRLIYTMHKGTTPSPHSSPD